MGLSAIAYGPDEVCLLTIDGADLLAYDAQSEAPRWQLTLARPLVAVHFADPQVLPGSGANPWRAPSVARAALVVDVEGHVHLVDTTLGQVVGEIGPLGKPLAVASSLAGAALALAVEDQVVVWRTGEQHQLPIRRARGLAFSNDGATLAVGNDKGELRMFHLASGKAPEETFRSDGRGAISALAQHPDGSWVVVAAQGVLLLNATGTSRLDRLSTGTRRLCFDGNGGRLAMQHSERGIVVYEWPRLSVLMRVEYTDRPVKGLSFGPENWLGVGLDHGDGNKIDVVTSDVNRTDTHPGRQHRSWALLVEGKKEMLSAKEAEDVRRMKDPFHVPAPAPSRFGGAGGRIGIGAMISIALISLRVCVRAATPSSSTWNYNPSLNNTPSLEGSRCGRACAAERLRRLKAACEAPTALCAADARAALEALEDGKCAEAKAAVARVNALASRTSGSGGSLLTVDGLLAQLGVEDACASGTIRPRVVRHAELVRLKGPGLVPSYEKIPELDRTQGEIPVSVWAAPDGSVFVATTAPAGAAEGKCVVYRWTKSGSWEAVYQKRGSKHAQVFGRTASDVYVRTDRELARFDGKQWEAVAVPELETFTASGSSSTDVFLAGTDDTWTQLHRRRGATWVKESLPPNVTVTDLFSGPSSTLWATAVATNDDVLLHRSANGVWSVKTPQNGGEPLMMTSVWTSPSGETFVAALDAVFRSKNAGATWTAEEPPYRVHDLWGRSSSDVYGGAASGLLHFDGKTWSTTSYQDRVEALTGTATEVLVVRAAASEDDR